MGEALALENFFGDFGAGHVTIVGDFLVFCHGALNLILGVKSDNKRGDDNEESGIVV